jgi:hypothetical protein
MRQELCSYLILPKEGPSLLVNKRGIMGGEVGKLLFSFSSGKGKTDFLSVTLGILFVHILYESLQVGKFFLSH